jgi:hypothetical protein
MLERIEHCNGLGNPATGLATATGSATVTGSATGHGLGHRDPTSARAHRARFNMLERIEQVVLP